MTSISWKTAGAALALAGVLLVPAVSARAGEAGDDAPATRLKLHLDRDGSEDRLVVEDLGALAVGETRSLNTEGGKPVTVTRDEEGWQLDVDGKKLRVAAPGSPGEGDLFVGRRVHVDDGEGRHPAMVVVTEESEPGEANVRVVRRIGPGGEHAFAFHHGEGAQPFVEHLVARLERNEKFQALDAATRATVLEALRESAPAPHWIEKGEGEPGERVIVLDLEERDGQPE
jgi:hypothetical protein